MSTQNFDNNLKGNVKTCPGVPIPAWPLGWSSDQNISHGIDQRVDKRRNRKVSRAPPEERKGNARDQVKQRKNNNHRKGLRHRLRNGKNREMPPAPQRRKQCCRKPRIGGKP